MTRSITSEASAKHCHSKQLTKFEDKFPDDTVIHRGRISSVPSFLPLSICRDTNGPWEEPRVREESIAELYAENRVNNRRHSWSMGFELENRQITWLQKNESRRSSASSESRRSSAASLIEDVIEECSSDDEIDTSDEVDYMQCVNCNQSRSTSSLDKTPSNSYIHLNMSYCYKCKHLFQSKKTNSSLFREFRGSPRPSHRNSLTDELPAICEPTFDNETNDTKELRLQVEKEVDKLIKFNRTSNIVRRNSTGCEFKNVNKYKRFISIRKNCDFN